MNARRGLRALALWAAAALAACGGGGGGGDAGTPAGQGNAANGTVNVVFSPATLAVTGIEGTADTSNLIVGVEYTGPSKDGVFVWIEWDGRVVTDVPGAFGTSSYNGTVQFNGGLAPGRYDTEIVVRTCLDEACTKVPQGSPARLPISYLVKPNLKVQPTLTLLRTGVDPAPDVTLPVSVPADAGTVRMDAVNQRPDALTVSLEEGGLHVQTRQVPAGDYLVHVALTGPTDHRYTRTVDIRYTVTAPPGGEHALSVAVPRRSVNLQQGAKTVERFSVTRPTWTDVWEQPQIVNDPQHLLTLVDLGQDLYEVTLDGSSVPIGNYNPSIRFSAGPTGGTEFASLDVSVGSAFYVEGVAPRELSVLSTAADLVWKLPVGTFDGVPARWSAVASSPLVHFIRSGGQTGVDALEFALDVAALDAVDGQVLVPVTVSIDRPGSLPMDLPISLANRIPTVQRVSPASLVGSAGRLYVEGAFPMFSLSGAQALARLQVSGATLVNAQVLTDPRYLGDLSVLALDVTGATPGQPITVRIDSALQPSQVQAAVRTALRAPASHQALEFGEHRAGRFAAGLDALYFVAPGAVQRWAFDGARWTLQQAGLPGVVDAAPSPDETTLVALEGDRLVGFDPVTLVRRATATLARDATQFDAFDGQAPAGLSALAFTADGRAVASESKSGALPGRGAGLICTALGARQIASFTSAPVACDPGVRVNGMVTDVGSALARSVNGAVVVAVDPDGARSLYRASERNWTSMSRAAAGAAIVAVSDSGNRFVRSDGMVLDAADRALGSLASVLPATHVAGGYALSSGGRFGLVYGYRITGSGVSSRAGDANVWVLDLDNAATLGVTGAPVLATLALPAAVGCTATPVAGETCEHRAALTVTPGDAMVFVLGPRGVSVVPLPASVNAAPPQAAGARRAAANAAPTPAPDARPSRRLIGRFPLAH